MTTYHHGDLRRALLRLAAEVLEKEGLGAISLRELARRAGVSHSAPYRHFADRDRLLAALAEEGFAMLGEALARRPRREMGEAYVEFALAHPQRFRLMFGARFAVHGRERAYEALIESFVDLGAHARHAAAAAWALVHGLAQLLLDGHFAGEERSAFVRDVLNSVRLGAPRRV